MAAFSLDLRRRILDAALAPGAAPEADIAERFGVSRPFVQKLKRRWRTDGTAEPVGHRGGAPSKLSDDDRAALVEWADGSDATGAALADRLATGRGVRVSVVTVNRALRGAGLTPQKKTLRAAERDREDVVAEREAFAAEQPGLHARRLVFLDETGSNITMTRRRHGLAGAAPSPVRSRSTGGRT